MKNAAGGTREFGTDFWCLYVFSGAIQPYRQQARCPSFRVPAQLLLDIIFLNVLPAAEC